MYSDIFGNTVKGAVRERQFAFRSAVTCDVVSRPGEPRGVAAA